MVHYRRCRIESASYFFTLALADREAKTLTEHAALLGDSLRRVQRLKPFRVDALVLLPEHLHMVWTLPESDSDYPSRIQALKAGFTFSLGRAAGLSLPLRTEGGRQLWQRRYWEHCLRDEDDLRRHIDYIHFNPVKHGWAQRAADWPYSSFQRHVRLGSYAEDWGVAEGLAEMSGNRGEP